MSSFAGLQRFISFGPSGHRAQPEHFLHHTNASPFGPTLLTMSCFSQVRLSPAFQLGVELLSHPHLGPTHFPCILMSHLTSHSSESRRGSACARTECLFFSAVVKGPRCTECVLAGAVFAPSFEGQIGWVWAGETKRKALDPNGPNADA